MARDDPPLIAGRIHGIRFWRIGVTDGTADLRGHGDQVWAAGGEPTVARCLSGGRRARIARGHHPPRPDCSCGLYALHPHASDGHGLYVWPRIPGKGEGDGFPDGVVGIVEAWGRVELHADGFRAQFARPHTLALIGAARDSDVGNVVVRLAERYGAEVVELESPEGLVEHCRARGLGLAPATVRSLVPRDRPEPPAVPATPRPKPGPSRLGRFAELLGMGLVFVVAAAWYAAIVAFAVVTALGVFRAITEPDPVEFPSHHLRIVDQALVELDGRLRYLAVVRNTSDHRLALAAFPRGTVRDQAGDPIVRLEDRERVDLRPSLLPGATGLIVDLLPRRVATDLPRRIDYEVEVRARRAPAAERAQAPLRLSAVSFDRERCRVAATAEAARPLRDARIAILARDRDGEITAGGWVSAGRLEAGRSRQVLFDGGDSGCPGWWQSTGLYPQLLPRQLKRL